MLTCRDLRSFLFFTHLRGALDLHLKNHTKQSSSFQYSTLNKLEERIEIQKKIIMTREREYLSQNKRNKRQGEKERGNKKHTITVHARGSESGWKERGSYCRFDLWCIMWGEGLVGSTCGKKRGKKKPMRGGGGGEEGIWLATLTTRLLTTTTTKRLSGGGPSTHERGFGIGWMDGVKGK